MTQIKHPYIQPEAYATEIITRYVLMGSLEKPGGQIDDFNFEETRSWAPDADESDF